VLVLLGLGILIDRMAFYRLALQRTTEAEIARIEVLLRTRTSA
jgi:hypothetical protein